MSKVSLALGRKLEEKAIAVQLNAFVKVKVWLEKELVNTAISGVEWEGGIKRVEFLTSLCIYVSQ